MIRFAVRRVIGLILVSFGLFALFTPLTPGAWLGLIGLELLGLGFLIPRRVRVHWDKWKADMHELMLRKKDAALAFFRKKFGMGTYGDVE